MREINYTKLVLEALKDAFLGLLSEVQEKGLPGRHHLYITFSTSDANTTISEKLRLKYPEEMTIVLQYEYENLEANLEGFSVDLSFDGEMESIYVSRSGLISFVDPEAKFALKLSEDNIETTGETSRDNESDKEGESSEEDNKGKIVDLDNYKKNKER